MSKSALDALNELDGLSSKLSDSIQDSIDENKEDIDDTTDVTIVCTECGTILEVNGVKLLPWFKYSGTKERTKLNDINKWYEYCEECKKKSDSVNYIEQIGGFEDIPLLNEQVKEQHIKRKPNILVSRPGYNWSSKEYQNERDAHIRSVKIMPYIEKIREEIKQELKDEAFEIALELPGKINFDHPEIKEIATIRALIKAGRNFKEVFRGNKYKYRNYSPGKIAEFYKKAKEGLLCIWCSGYFDKKYLPNTLCANCVNTPKENILKEEI